ncbi:hypothetical protein Tco_0751917 [Tanacetum coccineum]|uniref:Uncharacterized protein n=1 Tax=Tanacetum coccineum TaxID=301880 RepID=A0ABQ4Z703_9ASTR
MKFSVLEVCCLRNVIYSKVLNEKNNCQISTKNVWAKGNVEIWSKGNVEIWSKGNVEIWSKGNVEIWSKGNVEIWSKGNVEIWSKGNVEIWSKGNVEIWSKRNESWRQNAMNYFGEVSFINYTQVENDDLSHMQSEEATVGNIMKHEKSAAAIFSQLKCHRNQAAHIRDVLGVVANRRVGTLQHSGNPNAAENESTHKGTDSANNGSSSDLNATQEAKVQTEGANSSNNEANSNSNSVQNESTQTETTNNGGSSESQIHGPSSSSRTRERTTPEYQISSQVHAQFNATTADMAAGTNVVEPQRLNTEPEVTTFGPSAIVDLAFKLRYFFFGLTIKNLYILEDPASAESKELSRANILLQHIQKMLTQETKMMVATRDSRSIC